MCACNSKNTTAALQVSEPNDTIVQTATQENEAAEQPDMTAPEINPNAAGLITLSQCPTTDKHLSVKLSEDNDEAVICYDGKELQTISDKEGGLVAAGGEVPIYFMDANFDGFTDIFIGPGESRTYSTLLLWNNEKQEFERVGTLSEPTLQGFMLCPESKCVFEGGSSSAFAFDITLSTWEGNKLKKSEHLTVVSGPEAYGNNGVSNKYTLKGTDNSVTVSTDDISRLPELWQKAVEIYDL